MNHCPACGKSHEDMDPGCVYTALENLKAERDRYKAEADRMEAHANEGWDLANDRTREMMRYKGALEEIKSKYGPPHPGEAYHIAKGALEPNGK